MIWFYGILNRISADGYENLGWLDGRMMSMHLWRSIPPAPSHSVEAIEMIILFNYPINLSSSSTS
jgi:hypothetical protein